MTALLKAVLLMSKWFNHCQMKTYHKKNTQSEQFS